MKTKSITLCSRIFLLIVFTIVSTLSLNNFTTKAAFFQNGFDQSSSNINSLGSGISGMDTSFEGTSLDRAAREADAMFDQARQELNDIENTPLMQTKIGCDPNPGQANSCQKPQQIFGNEGICSSPGITGSNKSGVISCTKKLLMGPCELFELAVRAGERNTAATGTSNTINTEASSYACQEFIDPVSLETIKATTNALCISIIPDGGYSTGVTLDGKTPKPFIDVKKASEAGNVKYCNAIALKTTGGFDIIFSLVGYFFFLIQPFLIAAGVGMIIYCGVEIMYKGGGSGEEAVKKVYKQLQQVLMGLALLFLIKLFLTTVNGLFFTM